jgi:hypothetical protein
MMKYRVILNTALSLAVEIEAEDETYAADDAWLVAEAYAKTLRPLGDHRIVSVEATFDGIGADEVEELS